jgi:ArsR family transcriptional regulator
MDALVSQLKALAEHTRLRIVALLDRGELTVSELVQVLGQSQPRVSRHLKLLTDSGLAERLPEGAFVFYRLAENGSGRQLAKLISVLVPQDDPVLTGDLARLAVVKRARAEAAEAYFDRAAEDWNKIRDLHLSEDEVEAAMREAAGSGPFDLMIDVGVGTGRVLEVFADRVARGVGVDINHSMLNVARMNLERAGLEQFSVRQADVCALPFEDEAANLVTVHQVLHYLADPAPAIAECARVLKPCGVLLIVDFAPHQLEFLREDHSHRKLGFSDAEMADWIEAAGLAMSRRSALHSDENQSGRLTVKIWTARREPARAPEPRAASRSAAD